MKFEDYFVSESNDSAVHHLVSAQLAKIEAELQKIEVDPRYFRLGSAHKEIVGRIRAVLEREKETCTL